MHVLVTTDTIGGVWTYTRELVCGLLDRGHRVTLVSFGRTPTAAQAFWLRHNNLVYHPTAFPLEWMQGSQAGIAESARHLERIIHDSRPDVLHFNQFCYGALECGIPKVVVAHSDVVSWWNAVHGSDPEPSPWMEWYRTVVSNGLRCADAVVAPSKWMLEAVYEHFGQSLRGQEFRGRVIYNGRSAKRFLPFAGKTDCVLSVGRVWDEAKQISLLLARDQAVPIRIAGPAQHPEKLASAYVSMPSGSNIIFCGEQSEEQLCALYSDSAAYVATSRYEPFGLAPLEAALSRCALIANDIPVFHELWGDAACYFRRNDADELADTIRMLSEDAWLRCFYADKAYERARERFDAERMVTEYEDLYCDLTGQNLTGCTLIGGNLMDERTAA